VRHTDAIGYELRAFNRHRSRFWLKLQQLLLLAPPRRTSRRNKRWTMSPRQDVGPPAESGYAPRRSAHEVHVPSRPPREKLKHVSALRSSGILTASLIDQAPKRSTQTAAVLNTGATARTTQAVRTCADCRRSARTYRRALRRREGHPWPQCRRTSRRPAAKKSAPRRCP
jgi:hypothetical protein